MSGPVTRQFSQVAIQLRSRPDGDAGCYGERRLGDGDSTGLVLAIGAGRYRYPESMAAADLAVRWTLAAIGETQYADLEVTETQWRRAFAFSDAAVIALRPPGTAGKYRGASLLACSIAITGEYSIATVGGNRAWICQSSKVQTLFDSDALMELWIGTGIDHPEAVQVHTGHLNPGDRLAFATPGIDVMPEPALRRIFSKPADRADATLKRALQKVADPEFEGATVIILEALS